MPTAHGEDRMRTLGDGRFLIVASRSKGWTARSLAPASRFHPGTAVLWEGECYEVVFADTADGGAVHYVLAPWLPEHAIRHAERYDQEAEAERLAQWNEGAADQHRRSLLVWCFFFTGMVPGQVQQSWQERYGFPALPATLASAIVFFALGGFLTLLLVAAMFGAHVPGGPVLVLGPYFLVTSALRLFSVSSRRPMGTPLGTAVWLLWTSVRRAE